MARKIEELDVTSSQHFAELVVEAYKKCKGVQGLGAWNACVSGYIARNK